MIPLSKQITTICELQHPSPAGAVTNDTAETLGVPLAVGIPVEDSMIRHPFLFLCLSRTSVFSDLPQHPLHADALVGADERNSGHTPHSIPLSIQTQRAQKLPEKILDSFASQPHVVHQQTRL